MRDFDKPPSRSTHRYAWLWEPLEANASFVLRPMFGARAAYLNGKMQLCFFAKHEPWKGVLVCTDRLNHPSLQAEFPSLSPHPVLSKWLYLPESADDFEAVAQELVKRVNHHDARIGVESSPRKKRQ